MYSSREGENTGGDISQKEELKNEKRCLKHGPDSVIMGVVMANSRLRQFRRRSETKAADSAASTEAATEAATEGQPAAILLQQVILNSKTVDELTEAAKAEGEVVSLVCLMNGQTGHPWKYNVWIHTAFPITISRYEFF